MLRNENDLLEVIKKTAVAAVKSAKPVEVILGKVKVSDPLTIMVEGSLLIGEEFLIKTQSAREGFGSGDVLVLLRIQGGQKYLIIDKVVSE